ncbi:MAG: gamma-glutamylcyclotransferase [Rhizobiales bacterium]|nr:gamma-glutamylcyclotransferase [Hyphomicrobiales bacterium]
MDDFWVFGYGSLMWRPGFSFAKSVQAKLPGAHRALCVHSYHHRGTPSRPGLVLGLAAGGACRGMAFKVNGVDRDNVIAYLREREQVTLVYLERWRQIHLLENPIKKVSALCYMADPGHEQFAGRLTIEEQVARIRGNIGKSGNNEDYVHQTVGCLREMDIRDHQLEKLAAQLDLNAT